MKYGFRKILYGLGVFFLIVAMAGCAKEKVEDNQGAYYFRFKVNGQQKEYRQGALSNYNNKSGDDYITVLGGQTDILESEKNTFVIGLTTVGQNEPGKNYTNYSATTSGQAKAKLLLLTGFDENGIHFQSWSDDFTSIAPAGADLKCTLIIDEATSTYVKGRFSGVVYEEGFVNKKVLTDGEFYLQED